MSIVDNPLTIIKVYEIIEVFCMLYKRIRDLREDHDLTQREIGEILSCSQRVYSNYERGELDIPTEYLVKLADYYDVSIDYMLERTDNPKLTI